MFKQIFANRYAALVWVGLSLFAAAAFVSEGGGVDRLGQTAQQLAAQQAATGESDSSGLSSSEPELAEEEEPAIEPGEPAPETGDIVTGQDGRRYKVVGSTAPEPAPAEAPIN